MTLENMIKELLNPEPAKITAESKENGKINIKMDGRVLECIALSMAIADQLIEESKGALTVDAYCDMIKQAVNDHSKSKEQIDVELEIAKKLFESVFNK